VHGGIIDARYRSGPSLRELRGIALGLFAPPT
jgi:hypothetical protein